MAVSVAIPSAAHTVAPPRVITEALWLRWLSQTSTFEFRVVRSGRCPRGFSLWRWKGGDIAGLRARVEQHRALDAEYGDGRAEDRLRRLGDLLSDPRVARLDREHLLAVVVDARLRKLMQAMGSGSRAEFARSKRGRALAALRRSVGDFLAAFHGDRDSRAALADAARLEANARAHDAVAAVDETWRARRALGPREGWQPRQPYRPRDRGQAQGSGRAAHAETRVPGCERRRRLSALIAPWGQPPEKTRGRPPVPAPCSAPTLST